MSTEGVCLKSGRHTTDSVSLRNNVTPPLHLDSFPRGCGGWRGGVEGEGWGGGRERGGVTPQASLLPAAAVTSSSTPDPLQRHTAKVHRRVSEPAAWSFVSWWHNVTALVHCGQEKIVKCHLDEI